MMSKVLFIFFLALLANISAQEEWAQEYRPSSHSYEQKKGHHHNNHHSRSHKRTSRKKKPNIIMIMTDDQDVELGSLQFMPKLNRYLRDEGVYFENGFVSTPMCCPSRSSMLTGLYAHNHNVLTNNDNCSSTEWILKHEPKAFATYLQEAGYETGYFGKYLNKYDGERIPLGWKHWMALVRNSRFYNYTINFNGEKIRHGMDYSKDYFPDLITNQSLSFFKKSKRQKSNKPIMMVLSYPGPHGPEDSAPQYKDLFFNVTTHHTPAYDYAPNPDKQWILQVTERMEPVQKKFTDFLMTKRLQTLQSIDEAIEKLVKELESAGELDNTYIFYTSDHGYHLGQFGLVKGKAFPFDVDIKVPFFVRGPGIEKGSVRKDIVVNIDLAPTFLKLAGVNTPSHMDGEAIDFEKSRKEPTRNSFLVERGKMTHARYNVIKEFSDRNEIPLPNSRTPLLLENSKVTKRERLQAECQKPRYQSPCRLYQERKCVRKKNGDWKMQRCHHSLGRMSGKKDSFSDRLINSALQKLESQCECAGKNRHKIDGSVFFSGSDLSRFSRNRLRNRRRFRYRRSSSEVLRHEEDILEEIAEEEIDEVDFIIEDISDDLDNLLKQQMNATHHERTIGGVDTFSTTPPPPPPFDCRLNKNKKVDCSVHVYKDKHSLRNSRSYINEQIKRYRAQLFELKEIRKHLKSKMASSRSSKVNPSEVDEELMKGLDTVVQVDDILDLVSDGKKDAPCRCNAKALRELRRLKVMENRRLRREKIKRARLRRRLRKKELRHRRKERKVRKEKRKKKLQSCNANNDQNVNCFSHDNDHWKTAPLWTDGYFCACTNSNTNTYWCLRTVNETHNYLYCEFVSGIITYYDLNVDPYQLRNIYQTLNDLEINHMHKELQVLRESSGQKGRGSEHQQHSRVHSSRKHSRKNRKRKLKDFNERYGPFLPPVEVYYKKL
ncbi:extracellular sulfatase Sulf-1 [Lepeophtheirus salmonis]|nr:extracellular sulfatase Sulf-1-like [Lepeophtheirus salmonis]